jgi:NtrC-family two-component system response regulator AlgB
MGHRVAEAPSAAVALRVLSEENFDLAFLDLKLGKDDGLKLLPELLAAAPALGVVVVTAHATVGSAVEAMKRGAFDYLPKPFTPDQVRVALDRWRTVSGLKSQVANLTDQVRRTVPETDLAKARRLLDPLVREMGARELTTDAAVAKVSIVGSGIGNAPGYAAKMFGALADAGVNIEMISTSEIRITCIIAEDQVDAAARALHQAFRLDVPEGLEPSAAAS